MFTSLKDFIHSSDEASPLKSPENREKFIEATSLLMLEMAGADMDYDPEEVKVCFRTLEKSFALSDTDALKYLEKAEELRKDSEKISEMYQFLNETFEEEQKVLLLALVWKIVVADQKVDKQEMRLANQIRVRLQLSEDVAEEARKMAFQGVI